MLNNMLPICLRHLRVQLQLDGAISVSLVQIVNPWHMHYCCIHSVLSVSKVSKDNVTDVTFPNDEDLENSSFTSTRLAKIVIPKELILERLAMNANSNKRSSGLMMVPNAMQQTLYFQYSLLQPL